MESSQNLYNSTKLEINAWEQNSPIGLAAQGFIQNLSSDREIVASGNILQLGGSGGMLLQEIFDI